MRKLNDAELCELQRILVRHYGGETKEVIEAVQLFSKRRDLTIDYVLRAYGVQPQYDSYGGK